MKNSSATQFGTTEILEIKENSIIVLHNGNVTTAYAKYEDENGTYCLDHELNKLYVDFAALEAEKEEERREEEAEKAFFATDEMGNSNFKNSEKGIYTFDVMYAYGDDHRSSYGKKIVANNFEEANEKLNKAFKTIYEAEVTNFIQCDNPYAKENACLRK